MKLKRILRPLLPRGIRTHRVLTGPLKGSRIVTSWHDYPAAILGTTERPLLDWFSRNVKSGETWLDVGAHYGYTVLALCRGVGPRGRVFAYEPHLATAGYLMRTRSLNGLSQLTVVPVALGVPNQMAIHDLPVVRGMVDSTIESGGWTEQLLVARLDWLWDQIAGSSRAIHGVKIDVQGMEIAVLRGMVGLLREFRPKLVVEVHAGVDRLELTDVLREAGFSGPPEAVDAPQSPLPQFMDDKSYAFA